MSATPYHSYESFARAIERLIARAEEQGRDTDLDRVVSHLSKTPREMSTLASCMLLLDEDWRILVRDEIEALRRWGRQKGKEVNDDEIMSLMLDVYRRRRSR
jgi:hypothetical protein